MKKLKLNLDDLKVESFNTSTSEPIKGTVKGNWTYTNSCGEESDGIVICDTEQATCWNTCDATCFTNCATDCATCNGSCAADPSCQGPSCYGATCKPIPQCEIDP